MTTDEIKALIEHEKYSSDPYVSSLVTAIETLLARQAEVLARCDAVSRISLAGFLTDDIRAILNPENEA